MIFKEKEVGFYQTEWQGISFYDLAIDITSDLPSSEFYSKFYDSLFKKYDYFESLPEKWLISKNNTANNLLNHINKDDSVLSYGCGLGYIEHILHKKKINLSVYDFASNSSKWLFRDKHGLKEYNELTDKFDFIYISQLLYAFPYDDCVRLIKKLKKNLKPNGRILIIHTSINPLENGCNYKNIIKLLKSFLLPIFHFLKKKSVKNGQFWGWSRNNKMYIKIIKKSDMKVIKTLSYQNDEQSYIIIQNKT